MRLERPRRVQPAVLCLGGCAAGQTDDKRLCTGGIQAAFELSVEHVQQYKAAHDDLFSRLRLLYTAEYVPSVW